MHSANAYFTSEACMRLGLLPSGILSGDFSFKSFRTPPHTEDCYHRNLTFKGLCSGGEFERILAGSCSASVEAGFEVSLPQGEKVLPANYQGKRSIITLEVAPSAVEVVEGSYTAGGLKLHFTDSAGRQHRFLPITDRGFHEYAQHHRESGGLRALNESISTQDRLFLRIGLSRNYKSPAGKEGYWLQTNGIYAFPRDLRYLRPHRLESEEQ